MINITTATTTATTMKAMAAGGRAVMFFVGGEGEGVTEGLLVVGVAEPERGVACDED